MVAVCFSVVGAVITPRLPPKNSIGWFFCAIGLVGGARLFSAQYAAYSLSAERSSPLTFRAPSVCTVQGKVRATDPHPQMSTLSSGIPSIRRVRPLAHGGHVHLPARVSRPSSP